MSRSRTRREAILLATRVLFFGAVLVAAAVVEFRVRGALDDPETYTAPAAVAAPERVGEIEAAHRDHRSGFMTQASGTVASVLPDDRDGSRHQRFLVRLESGHSVLIAHNIDLAERVPLGRGDRVTFRGQYEWNDRGGVIHWTHHDPAGRHEGGWIEHRDERYQ